MYIEKNTLRETIDRGVSVIPFYVYHEIWNNYNLYLHWHNEFEIIYIEKGSIIYTVETVPIRLSEGQCIIINSGQLHSAHSLNNGPCLHHALLFDMNFLNSSSNDYCQVNYVTPLLNGEFRFPQIVDENSQWGIKLINEVKELIELYDKKIFGWEIGIKASLYKIIAGIAVENKFILRENNSASSLSYKINIIKNSLNYIQNNYKNKIYIKDLAKEANLNPQYFCRFFKTNTGKTPVDFINQYRVEQAAKLIIMNDKKISDICFEVGFDNFSYFIKKFKEYKNCTPGSFKDLSVSKSFT